MSPRVAILYGPTASGKSALALAVAAGLPVVIINADAMQLYSELQILTARPNAQEEAMAEHRLYGCIDRNVIGNAALWLQMAVAEIKAAWAAGKLPLLVGGTGMYLHCLQRGLSPVPEIPDSIRTATRALGKNAYPHLQQLDPLMAARLKPGDTQRILRAIEVIETTGQSLAIWQQQTTMPPLPDAEFLQFKIIPQRDILYKRINQRFEQMMAEGALDEVRQLYLTRAFYAASPLMRAHGVPELLAYLHGEMSRADAIRLGQQHTRNYAKRQLTWARQQLPDAMQVESVFDLMTTLS
jgi:tRNA dimethylallyltransferase